MVEAIGNGYKIIENKNSCFDKEEFLNKVTDYFKDFDYIVGDFSYQKVRLKGFYDELSKDKKDYNDISKLQDYLENECSYECSYYLLKKI